jgi:diguanylate cyclase (GGDEF)-like protein
VPANLRNLADKKMKRFFRAKYWVGMKPDVHTVTAAIAGLFICVSVWYLTLASEHRAYELEFAGRANNQRTILQNGINNYWDKLVAVRALFDSDASVSRTEFESFAKSLLEGHPAILNISWLPLVKREERAAHEREAVRDGLANYHIRTIGPDGTLPVSPEHDEYVPKFYSTEARDSPVYGLDNKDGGGREQALERIRDGNVLSTSPPILLHIGDGDRRGFWAGVPVYALGKPHDTPEERHRNLRGIVQGVFQVGVMIDGIFGDVRAPVRLYVFAPGASPDDKPFYSRSRFDSDQIEPRSQAQLALELHRSYPVDIGDRQWTMVLTPEPAAASSWIVARHQLSTIVLVCGLLLNGALTAFIFTTRRYAQNIETAQTRIARQNVQFDAALNNMTQGLLMYDSDGKLCVTNKRMAQIFGMPWDAWQASAIGTTPLQSLQAAFELTKVGMKDPQRVLGELQAVLASGKPGRIVFERQNGRSYSSLCSPMSDGGFVITFNDITERRHAEEKIAHMAHHDTLTDLLNRGQFYEKMNDFLRGTARRRRIAVVSMDLDRFKHVNDSFGHPIGDKLLQAVAGRMRACVRDIDIVARLGGDEFAIVQTSFEGPSDTVILARRLIDSVSAPYRIDGHRITVGTSIGIAVAPQDGTDPELLMKNADAALYRAKASGGDTYRFFNEEFESCFRRPRVAPAHGPPRRRVHA